LIVTKVIFGKISFVPITQTILIVTVRRRKRDYTSAARGGSESGPHRPQPPGALQRDQLLAAVLVKEMDMTLSEVAYGMLYLLWHNIAIVLLGLLLLGFIIAHEKGWIIRPEQFRLRKQKKMAVKRTRRPRLVKQRRSA
jgi:hypothetical protein